MSFQFNVSVLIVLCAAQFLLVLSIDEALAGDDLPADSFASIDGVRLFATESIGVLQQHIENDLPAEVKLEALGTLREMQATLSQCESTALDSQMAAHANRIADYYACCKRGVDDAWMRLGLLRARHYATSGAVRLTFF